MQGHRNSNSGEVSTNVQFVSRRVPISFSARTFVQFSKLDFFLVKVLQMCFIFEHVIFPMSFESERKTLNIVMLQFGFVYTHVRGIRRLKTRKRYVKDSLRTHRARPWVTAATPHSDAPRTHLLRERTIRSASRVRQTCLWNLLVRHISVL